MKFTELFQDKAVIGMIHMSGPNHIDRALREIEIYEANGVDGVIVENYNSGTKHVYQTLQELRGVDLALKVGVNILGRTRLREDRYDGAFLSSKIYGTEFVQIDRIAGYYNQGDHLDMKMYGEMRSTYPNVVVLGGVWPKYYTPQPTSNFEEDLLEGKKRCEAIVITGDGTGKETPTPKLLKAREVVGNHPIIVGAGVTVQNAYEQMQIANGAIIGSAFKPHGKTTEMVHGDLVAAVMEEVRRVPRA